MILFPILNLNRTFTCFRKAVYLCTLILPKPHKYPFLAMELYGLTKYALFTQSTLHRKINVYSKQINEKCMTKEICNVVCHINGKRQTKKKYRNDKPASESDFF